MLAEQRDRATEREAHRRPRYLPVNGASARGSRLRRYVRYHGLRHPAELGHAEVVAFLTYLAPEQRVARSAQVQAMSALILLNRDVLRGAPRTGWSCDMWLRSGSGGDTGAGQS